MSTATPTPIWSMPRPRSLPNGMPLPETFEEPVQFRIVGQNTAIPSQVVRPGTQSTFTFVLDRASGGEWLSTLDRRFEDALAEYWVVPAADRMIVKPPEVSRDQVVRAMEDLRNGLELTAHEMAAIAGIKERRFYDLLADKPFPKERLASIADRVATVTALATRDWQTTVSLIRGRATEVLEFLGTARLGDLVCLFNRTLSERRELLGGSLGNVLGRAADRGDEVTTLVEQPGFDAVAEVVHWIGRSDALRERTQSALELGSTLKGLETEAEVAEQYDFLFGLDPEERAAFKRRAEAMIRADEFTAARWRTFVDAEARQAWADVAPSLPAVDESIYSCPDEEPIAAGWQPDLTSLGVDLRLHDRRRG